VDIRDVEKEIILGEEDKNKGAKASEEKGTTTMIEAVWPGR
jgi:hypothetical protein